jgi:hypothetical protein
LGAGRLCCSCRRHLFVAISFTNQRFAIAFAIVFAINLRVISTGCYLPFDINHRLVFELLDDALELELELELSFDTNACTMFPAALKTMLTSALSGAYSYTF